MFMNSRDNDQDLLDRCTAAARDEHSNAHDQREANVFSLAAMVLRYRFPTESARLMLASDRYFRLHPGERVPSADVVRKGWVLALPRLRDMLTMQLRLR